VHRLDQRGNFLGVPDDGELCAGHGCATNHLRRNAIATGQDYRVAMGERGALRPLGHAERIQALGEQRMPRLFLEQITEALGPAMRDWKSRNMPTRLNKNEARRHRTQPIASLALRPDGLGEIAAYEGDRLAAADDLDRAAHPVKSKRRDEARQSQNMIEMGMRQQHMSQPAKPDAGAHQLALGSLTAIDEEAIRPCAHEQRRQSTLGGRYGRRSPKE
jgi:hypothetical protein